MVNEILKTDIPDDWDIKKLEPNVGFVRSGKRLPNKGKLLRYCVM